MLEISESSAHPLPLTAAEQRLVHRIEACKSRAAETSRPALLRLHARLPSLEPWSLWLRQADPSQPFCVFHDGRSRLSVAAWGRLQQRFFAFEARFAAARDYCSQLLEQVVDVCLEAEGTPEVDVPLAFAGFAFAEGGGTELWESWEGGAMYVPPTLVYRRNDASATCGALVNAQVTPQTDSPRLAQRLMRQVTELQAEGGRGEALPEVAAQACALEMALPEDAASWQGRVKRAAAATQAGAIQKVVLARAADFVAPKGEQFDPRATLLAMRHAQPHAVCFAMGRGDGACFLGATPEILVQVSGRTLFTQAVAGTAPRGTTEAEDRQNGEALLASPKDRGEHQVVVDVLRQALQPQCVELQSPEVPQLILLPQLQHLETPFVGTLRQAGGILEWVEALHPTPSVGGWPAGDSTAYLAEHEPLDRGWYAGPVGWLTAAGDGAFAVAIRSVLMQGKVARAYTGAGIVGASDPQAEWRETELKLRTVRDALRVCAR